ncbi:transglycosylase SLT domain-containing protein [Methylobacterium sp. Leaf89]|uniref:lytic transglycosylase domain-containing protein n=1 Tax=Methylobacterium sp. Leaf89 TaxID=1736245 RepID=UPI000AE4C64C|nr:transglycosylase SLT domain-containing protein [Methylobacterium sp. Leaf89]
MPKARPLIALGLLCVAAEAQAQPARMVLAHADHLIPLLADTDLPPHQGSARTAYRLIVHREAASEGLPAEIADAVTQIESGYDPTVIGGAGEIGLMQVLPTTAAMLGFRGSPAELARPDVNVRYGVRYLAEAWRLAKGDLCRTLMKYRAGHGSDVMSPLSVTYCRRAQSVLDVPEAQREAQAPPGSLRRADRASLTRTPLPKGAKRGTPEFEKAYWAAHEARIAKLKARVQANWRARGAKPV